MSSAPVEPILELSEIQGIVVPGFLKQHQTLLYLRVPKDNAVVEKFRSFLATLAVSNGRDALHDRRQHRAYRMTAEPRPHADPVVLTAIAFTYDGLARLVPSAYTLTSEAFKHGMARRSSLLGDPSSDPASEGDPRNWRVGGPETGLDAMLIVAGDTREEVTACALKLAAPLREAGITIDIEDGDARSDAPGHEHFGFKDGVSQPGIRGRASKAATDYVTARYIDPTEQPAAWLYGYPGQALVWPGEFVFGYPATSPDPLVPGPISTAGPEWARNGSYLVYRRLRQDVVAFWQTMRDEAARLAQLPGYEKMTADRLAALLVGRWPSGAPVVRTPHEDIAKLGASPLANNHFLFDSDTPELKLVDGQKDPFPRAKADPVGITCPWAAHIRKVNTRDSASDVGGVSSTQDRRMLRVGVTFGESLPEPARYGDIPDPNHGERGLLFLSIQTSIEDQFEFLQARWINDDSRPKLPGGHDLIVGQNAAAPDGVRRCTLFGGNLAQAQVSSPRQFVIPTGGGYFFVPSISTLRNVIAATGH